MLQDGTSSVGSSPVDGQDISPNSVNTNSITSVTIDTQLLTASMGILYGSVNLTSGSPVKTYNAVNFYDDGSLTTGFAVSPYIDVGVLKVRKTPAVGVQYPMGLVLGRVSVNIVAVALAGSITKCRVTPGINFSIGESMTKSKTVDGVLDKPTIPGDELMFLPLQTVVGAVSGFQYWFLVR
jgi:hypothetical protein